MFDLAAAAASLVTESGMAVFVYPFDRRARLGDALEQSGLRDVVWTEVYRGGASPRAASSTHAVVACARLSATPRHATVQRHMHAPGCTDDTRYASWVESFFSKLGI